MTRLEWSFLSRCILGVLVAASGLFVAFQLKGLEESRVLAGMAGLAPWAAGAGLVTGVLLIAESGWRLLRWEHGGGPVCRYCGGPLGVEREGRYGPFRRCVACDRNTSARYYH